MFFSVSELELRKADFDVDLQPGQLDFSDDHLKQLSPLHAGGVAEVMTVSLAEIRVKGSYSVRMQADCDRCLELAEFQIENKEFDLFYRPDIVDAGQSEIRLKEGETEVGFYSDGGLELNDVLREQVLLDLPMQRTCRPDCKGVCPYCGQNRNLTECGCKQAQHDERWSALKNLKAR